MDNPGGRRGRTHDAEGTRQALLDAAEKVFSEHGFDGARVDAIAKTAGYNKSLIFQYFGDKFSLYAAVIRRTDDRTRTMQYQALTDFRQVSEPFDINELKRLFREYIGWYFDYLVEHPNVVRIYVWEMAEGWRTWAKALSETDFKDVEDFLPVFKSVQEAGFMRAGADAMLQFTIASFTSFTALAIVPLYQFLTSENANSPQELAQLRDFVVEFIANGLLILPPKAGIK